MLTINCEKIYKETGNVPLKIFLKMFENINTVATYICFVFHVLFDVVNTMSNRVGGSRMS